MALRSLVCYSDSHIMWCHCIWVRTILYTMENVTLTIWLGLTFLLYLNQSLEFNQAARGYRKLYREARKCSKICNNLSCSYRNWVLLMAKRTVRKSLLFGWKKDLKKKYKRLWVFIVKQKRKQELIVTSWSTWKDDHMSGWLSLSVDILLIYLFFLHG